MVCSVTAVAGRGMKPPALQTFLKLLTDAASPQAINRSATIIRTVPAAASGANPVHHEKAGQGVRALSKGRRPPEQSHITL